MSELPKRVVRRIAESTMRNRKTTSIERVNHIQTNTHVYSIGNLLYLLAVTVLRLNNHFI